MCGKFFRFYRSYTMKVRDVYLPLVARRNMGGHRFVFGDKPFPEEAREKAIEFGPLILDLNCRKGSNE